MLAPGKTPKVLTAVLSGAGDRHSRGEMAARPRYQARKGSVWGNGMAVFVLSKHGKPLMPCTEKRARLLPFVIRLKDRLDGVRQPVQLKLDPGSRTTGVALVRETQRGGAVLSLFELAHRGLAIRKTLEQRRGFRRRRRSQLRYRASRFLNRRKSQGWLAPSLHHRVGSTLAWVKRLQLAHQHCTVLQRADGYGYSQQIVATTTEDARTG
jgi:RRXRR protein